MKTEIDENKKSKQKKPKNKKLKISILVILIVIVIGSILGYFQIYLPMQTEYSLKIYKDNNYLIDEVDFKNNSYIQVLNQEEEVINKINLTTDTEEIKLEKLEDPKDLIFDTWQIEKKVIEYEEFYYRDIVYFEAKPIYKTKEDYTLEFTTDEKAIVTLDEQEIEYIRKSYKKGNNLKDYLPEIKIHKDFDGDWTINNKKIEDNTEITRDTILEFQTYQDKNKNKIDDFTEEFKVTFETNVSDIKVDSRIVKWEETIELPVLKLKDNDKVFYEWYLDKEFKKKFTEKDMITSDITLYAKVKSYNEVINNSVEDPIYRQDIVLQVEEILNKKNKVIEDTYNKEISQIEEEKKKEEEYNKKNNIIVPEKQQVIDLYNVNHSKLYLINFLDTQSNFIYSIVAPYGQTIKILDEKGKPYKEYGVRQNTSIILDEDILLSKTSDLKEYYSEYKQQNETVFITIQPIKK